MASSWGKSWGDSWGNSWGTPVVVSTGGGAVKTRVKAKRKKKEEEEYTEAEAQGMAAAFGQGFTKEPEAEETAVIDKEIAVIDDTLKNLGEISTSQMTFDDSLNLLETQVQLNAKMKKQLQKTQDVGLILAIIEALD